MEDRGWGHSVFNLEKNVQADRPVCSMHAVFSGSWLKNVLFKDHGRCTRSESYLGFDTSSEVALLGISSVEAAKGTLSWVILILPALFTAGMCLLDTFDGPLMFSLYIQPSANFLPPKQDSRDPVNSSEANGNNGLSQSRDNHRDPIAFLYYPIVLTTLTVLVATVIGVIQLLTMILNVTNFTGEFWDGLQMAREY